MDKSIVVLGSIAYWPTSYCTVRSENHVYLTESPKALAALVTPMQWPLPDGVPFKLALSVGAR